MKEKDRFKLDVISPERVLISQEVASVVLLSGLGSSMGVLPRHAPLIAKTNTGTLKIRDINKKETVIFVSSGFIMVSLEGVSIVVRSAEKKEMIDVDRARAAQERAKKRLISRDMYIDLQRAREALVRAEYRLKLARGAAG